MKTTIDVNNPKLPDGAELQPLVVAELLKQYERYGLAALVERGWNWRPVPKDSKLKDQDDFA